MALSANARRKLELATGSVEVAKEVADVVDSHTTSIAAYDALNPTVGAAATAGVAATETVVGPFRKTVLTFTNVSITMTDATTAGCHGGTKVYDFPAGLALILGAVTDLQIAAGAGGISDTAAVVGAVGTVVAATNNETLTSTEANIVPSTAATLTSGAGNCDGEATTSPLLDGTATAIDMYLNFAVPDADSSASDTITVNGTITFLWTIIGDN